LVGCAELTQVAQHALSSSGSSSSSAATQEASLTQSDINSGLKEALIAGAKNAAVILGKTDGYYKDELVKILLPSEADVIVDNISKIPGGSQLVENALQGINRAAEDAAKDAAPVFINSIKSMTIVDALDILKGKDNAATQYLRKTTYDQLFELYQPKIKASVEKKLVGNVSTKSTWDNLTGEWNNVAGSMVGQVAGFNAVETNLEDYLTQKALDGLFLKIADQEKLIRKDPAARATNLLKKVFGSQD